MPSSGKLIFKGIFLALLKAVTCMLIPYLSFKYISELEVMGIPIGLTNEQFDLIMYWITALGLVQIAVSFGKGSSPKRSPRKAIFFIMQIGVYCLYLWCYKFSGAASLTLSFEYGSVTYDLATMLQLWMGIVVLKILIAIYDLIDGIIYTRKKKREAKEEDILEITEPLYDKEDFSSAVLDRENPAPRNTKVGSNDSDFEQFIQDKEGVK
ncbi:MAG: hypothetical protein GF364_12465 [Candidatus Lokiarchaeota archaeon]|nr:hypothetical protein [Candidatus Lokiarchaeota archaeon]